MNTSSKADSTNSERHYDEIRPIANVWELEAVYRLTHENYVASSYVAPQQNGLLLHYPEYDVIPETTVLVAVKGKKIVGSISLTIGNTEKLTIAHDFPDACRKVEEEGGVMCGVWRLVIEESHRNSRQILFGLISETLRRMFTNHVTSYLFVVNPKHAGVYKRLFNMYVIAEKEATDGLHNAAAVLLRADYATTPEQWRLGSASVKSLQTVGLLSLEPILSPAADSHKAA